MRARTLLAVALALLVVGCGGAAAADTGTPISTPTYPGQRPATDARTMVEVDVATAYWRSRGLTGCISGVRAFYARSLRDGDGLAVGRGGDCTIWLDAQPIEDLRYELPGTGRWAWRDDAKQECWIVLHEVGHALGLAHEDADRFPVMDPNHGTPTPRECARLARLLYPRRR